jgi:hypothetical protein
MKLKLALALCLCALVGVSVGCASTMGGGGMDTELEGNPDIMTGIPLAADFRIADIPVPAGFTFDRDDSFVFQNSQIDVGRIQYSGKEEMGDVAQFYLDEMARYNWTLLHVTEYSAIIMFFDKPDKSCQVVLTPRTRGTVIIGTKIQISFFPKEPEQALQE